DQHWNVFTQHRRIDQLEQNCRLTRAPLTIEDDHALDFPCQVIRQEVHIFFTAVEHLAILCWRTSGIRVGDVAKLLIGLSQHQTIFILHQLKGVVSIVIGNVKFQVQCRAMGLEDEFSSDFILRTNYLCLKDITSNNIELLIVLALKKTDFHNTRWTTPIVLDHKPQTHLLLIAHIFCLEFHLEFRFASQHVQLGQHQLFPFSQQQDKDLVVGQLRNWLL